MEFDAVLTSRRSVAKVTDAPVARADVEAVIEAGGWAPTHKRTQPWRFVVFTGEGCAKLDGAMVEGTRTLYETALSGPELAQKQEVMRGKALRAPVVIAVWAACGRAALNPPVWEDHAAVSACLQNMCLKAHALGLGAIWRSGRVVEMPQVQALCRVGEDAFDAEKGDAILGFLYLGHPDKQFPTPHRDAPETVAQTAWVDF